MIGDESAARELHTDACPCARQRRRNSSASPPGAPPATVDGYARRPRSWQLEVSITSASSAAIGERPRARPPPTSLLPSPSMHLAVVNRSAHVRPAELRRMVAACALQLRRDVAPAWGRLPAPVKAHGSADEAPTDALVLTLLDRPADAENLLGVHGEVAKNGRPYGEVYPNRILDAGESISHVLSHEILEAFINPDLNLWAEGRPGEMWAYEICDPVHADAYPVDIAGHEVLVANFVYPAWFDIQRQVGAPLDHLGLVKRPFQIRPRGYAIRWDGRGDEEYIAGARFRGGPDVPRVADARPRRR